jgi:hypothetical protein
VSKHIRERTFLFIEITPLIKMSIDVEKIRITARLSRIILAPGHFFLDHGSGKAPEGVKKPRIPLINMDPEDFTFLARAAYHF